MGGRYRGGWLFIGLLGLSLLAACTGPAARSTPPSPAAPLPGNLTQSLVHGGLTRSYVLHLPPAISQGKPLPLVVALHAAFTDAAQLERYTGLSAKADREGFIVVYPNGTGEGADTTRLTWNVGFCCGMAPVRGADDIGFIETLIGQLRQSYAIAARRIYVTGHSNSAMLAYQLGLKLPGTLAAIAPVSGALRGNESPPSQPLPVVVFHGTADQVVAYDGSRLFQPVPETIQFWVKADHSSPVAQKQITGNVVRGLYAGGGQGVDVVLYTLTGGGHLWPSGELNATDQIWAFFASHPKG